MGAHVPKAQGLKLRNPAIAKESRPYVATAENQRPTSGHKEKAISQKRLLRLRCCQTL